MVDVRESFPTLEDATGAGIALSKSSAGDAASAKRGETVFWLQDINGNIQFGNLDRYNQIVVANAPRDGVKPTYSAVVNDLVVAGAPTDIFTITGSASQTVRITRIGISGTQTTSSIVDILLIKRSAANTGGTSTTRTAVPHDSTSAVATAIVHAYTANPTTLGTAVGTMRAIKMDIEETNPLNSNDRVELTFGNGPSQSIVLHGTSELLAINLNGSGVTGSSFDIYIEWTEDS